MTLRCERLRPTAPKGIDHRPRSGDRLMCQLGVGSIEIPMVKQGPQAAQKVLFAAAVERRQVLRAKKPVPRHMRKNSKIARRKLHRWRLFAPFKPPRSGAFNNGLHSVIISPRGPFPTSTRNVSGSSRSVLLHRGHFTKTRGAFNVLPRLRASAPRPLC